MACYFVDVIGVAVIVVVLVLLFLTIFTFRMFNLFSAAAVFLQCTHFYIVISPSTVLLTD